MSAIPSLETNIPQMAWNTARSPLASRVEPLKRPEDAALLSTPEKSPLLQKKSEPFVSPWNTPWPAGGPYAREHQPLSFGPSKDVNILTRSYDRQGQLIPEEAQGVEVLKPHGIMDLFG